MNFRMRPPLVNLIMGAIGFVSQVTMIGVFVFRPDMVEPASLLLETIVHMAVIFLALGCLWLVLCFVPPIGLIQVTDDHLLVRRWPLARSLNWKELQEVRGFIAERGEPKIVGLRRDGTVTKPVSIMFGSPPHNDWWAEVIRQMDAHGISHPGLDLESGRPYTSLDLNLKTGEIKPVSEGKVRDW